MASFPTQKQQVAHLCRSLFRGGGGKKASRVYLLLAVQSIIPARVTLNFVPPPPPSPKRPPFGPPLCYQESRVKDGEGAFCLGKVVTKCGTDGRSVSAI